MRSRNCGRTTLVLVGFLLSLGSASKAAADAQRFGGIEIGSKGIKWLAVEIDDARAANPVKLLGTGDVNTTLSRLRGNLFAQDALEDTASAVQKFFDKLASPQGFGVRRGHIFIVASSGLPIPANMDALKDLIRQKTGIGLEVLSVENEVRLAIRGLILQNEQNVSLLLDIGSGNTKGGFLSQRPGQTSVSVVTLPGTVTFTTEIAKGVKQSKKDFAAVAADKKDSFLMPALKKQISATPTLKDRDPIYLAGGVVWAMVTLAYPEKFEDEHVDVTPHDIRGFIESLTQKPGAFPEIQQKNLPPGALKEIGRVRDTFTPDNLLAGGQILAALSETFGFAEHRVRFARNGRIAWLLGYIVERTGLKKDGRAEESPTRPPAPKLDPLVAPSGLSMSPDELLSTCGFSGSCYVYDDAGSAELAQACIRHGLDADAAVLLDHALRQNSSKAYVWYLKGFAELRLGRCSHAAETAKGFKKMMGLGPDANLGYVQESFNGPETGRFYEFVRAAQTDER